MDVWNIQVSVGVHGADYAIMRHSRDGLGNIVRGGMSTGLIPGQLAGEELGAVLEALGEELFNVAKAPPWS
jgi:hypothetical protein